MSAIQVPRRTRMGIYSLPICLQIIHNSQNLTRNIIEYQWQPSCGYTAGTRLTTTKLMIINMSCIMYSRRVGLFYHKQIFSSQPSVCFCIAGAYYMRFITLARTTIQRVPTRRQRTHCSGARTHTLSPNGCNRSTDRHIARH